MMSDVCLYYCIFISYRLVVYLYHFCCLFWLFFFKQKTAYEMRISDWSSDVCSSDVSPINHRISKRLSHRLTAILEMLDGSAPPPPPWAAPPPGPLASQSKKKAKAERGGERSEEHTSELQSLMRISYAVICLKKKNNNKPQKHEQYDSNVK